MRDGDRNIIGSKRGWQLQSKLISFVQKECCMKSTTLPSRRVEPTLKYHLTKLRSTSKLLCLINLDKFQIVRENKHKMANKGVNPISIVKGIYNNEFQWMVVKSFGLFFLGIRLAKEFTGIEIMQSVAPA